MSYTLLLALPGRKSNRLLVCGGRDFAGFMAWRHVRRVLDHIHGRAKLDCIMHGCARGADTLAQRWADAHEDVPCLRCPADWDKYGKAAGIIRNAEMLSDGYPSIAVAFPGGRGTRDMVNRLLAAGFVVRDRRPY